MVVMCLLAFDSVALLKLRGFTVRLVGTVTPTPAEPALDDELTSRRRRRRLLTGNALFLYVRSTLTTAELMSLSPANSYGFRVNVTIYSGAAGIL